MFRFTRKITAIAVSAALCSVSTAAIAAAPAPVTPVATSAWTTLGVMSTSSAASLATAEDYRGDGPGFPPIPALIVILGTLALGIYVLTKNDSSDHNFPPISPN